MGHSAVTRWRKVRKENKVGQRQGTGECMHVYVCACMCNSQISVLLSVNITLTLVYQRPVTHVYQYSAVILDCHVTSMRKSTHTQIFN